MIKHTQPSKGRGAKSRIGGLVKAEGYFLKLNQAWTGYQRKGGSLS